MDSLDSVEAFDALRTAPCAVIFKHSTQCPVSAGAQREVQTFVAEHPEIPVYRVLVIEQRALSRTVESQTGVRHESPQILLMKNGRIAYEASHSQITSEALVAAIES